VFGYLGETLALVVHNFAFAELWLFYLIFRVLELCQSLQNVYAPKTALDMSGAWHLHSILGFF
jgi:hypothetical protein